MSLVPCLHDHVTLCNDSWYGACAECLFLSIFIESAAGGDYVSSEIWWKVALVWFDKKSQYLIETVFQSEVVILHMYHKDF